MAIVNVVTALQAINLGIDGIQSAPAILPASIGTADLPIALTFAGPGTWSKFAAAKGVIQLERVYTIRVLVKPVAQGQGIAEGYNATIPLLQAFGDRYLFDLTLGGIANKVDNLTDNGAVAMMMNGVEYWGFELRMRVTQLLVVGDVSLPPLGIVEHIIASGTPGPFTTP